MSLSPAPNGAGGMVTVRLSEIDPGLRLAVALRLERAWDKAGVSGREMLRLRMAAEAAFPDAAIEVPAEKAHRVLVERKQPLGKTPTFV